MNLKNFSLLLILFSCQCSDYKDSSQMEIIENKIISQTAQQLKKEKNLNAIGIGKSSLEGKEFLAISFRYYKPLNIEKSRELIIYAAQTFLENLNQNEKLQKLIKKPYTMNNIAIDLVSLMPDYSIPKPPNLSAISLKRNIIIYYYDVGNLKEVHKETYQEALEKLKKQEIKT